MPAASTLLLPQPRSIVRLDGASGLPTHGLVCLVAPQPQAITVAATWLGDALERATGRRPDIVAGSAAPTDRLAVELRVDPGAVAHDQGYDLNIGDGTIRIVAATPAGAFYGAATARQLVDAYGARLPNLAISDAPVFANRGVMLDVSRDRVPTIETLYVLVDRLASWKINQLQLYMEHTFAYRQHAEVWAEASPMTGDEIRALDAYCRVRFVELVPNQNSFGHLHRWLALPRYRPLAESPDGYGSPFGPVSRPFSLCPTDPASLDLLRGLYDDLLPHFSSGQFNVGCDETEDVGQGRSRAAAEERGVGRVYLDFLLAIAAEVRARGRRTQFWADILQQHPDLLAELPPDVTALEWGYEADHRFAERTRRLADAGVPFYVCPGTSSWQSIAGRTSNALANLRAAARAGADNGAQGMLICDWGDAGHWQPLPVSYLPFAYGAGLAWSGPEGRAADPADDATDLLAAAHRHAFYGNTDLAEAAHQLGEAYAMTGADIGGTSPLFLMLQAAPSVVSALMAGRPQPPNDANFLITPTVVRELPNVNRADVEACLRHLDEQADRVQSADLSGLPADERARIGFELAWAADMLRHATRRGLWLLGLAGGEEDRRRRLELAAEAPSLEERFVAAWRLRSRDGGLPDSLARMRRSFADYSGRPR